MSLPLPSTLVARTVEVRDVGDLLALLPSADLRDALTWVRRGDGLVAFGEVARIETTGADRFADADAAWAELVRGAVVRDAVELPGTGPVCFGSFAFSQHSRDGGVLVVPEVVIGRRDGVTWMTTMSTGSLPPGPALAVPERTEELRPRTTVRFRDGALDPEAWQGSVRAVIEVIRSGAVGKVVMARDVVAELDSEPDARRVLGTLATGYPSCWTFAVDGMIGATPELLVRRERGLLSSRVLAGTIQRTGDDARDLARAGALARSSKDLEEHEFAVDSLTESLRPFVASTSAPETPSVLHLPNVMHLATDVTAVLDPEHADMSSLAVAAALHPTAAVCGTPTLPAAEVIAEHERMDRGRYAAPVGWMGADGDGEWGIALRSAAVVAPTTLRLFAGCGIVAASDPAAELAESEAKLEPMRTALS
ncbi:MAG TPA: isochorismate synthase [Actinotalea caeni]|uniref:isochorismate synthase n=1 Tax=Actinotalea caeni TaxID=1348467 RepID=UPI0012E31C91|nr:isochorismate synthase [Actinotalea caeni]HLV56699.1 isochorismate synthase [Actinotalea caeni]